MTELDEDAIVNAYDPKVSAQKQMLCSSRTLDYPAATERRDERLNDVQRVVENEVWEQVSDGSVLKQSARGTV